MSFRSDAIIHLPCIGNARHVYAPLLTPTEDATILSLQYCREDIVRFTPSTLLLAVEELLRHKRPNYLLRRSVEPVEVAVETMRKEIEPAYSGRAFLSRDRSHIHIDLPVSGRGGDRVRLTCNPKWLHFILAHYDAVGINQPIEVQ